MLHGRQRECVLIDELLTAARDRRSGVLVMRGEAGIGKSALLSHAAERAAGMRVLRGTGIESESELPFAAVAPAAASGGRPVDAVPARLGAALRGAFGPARPAARTGSSISLGVLSVLAEAAEEGRCSASSMTRTGWTARRRTP